MHSDMKKSIYVNDPKRKGPPSLALLLMLPFHVCKAPTNFPSVERKSSKIQFTNKPKVFRKEIRFSELHVENYACNQSPMHMVMMVAALLDLRVVSGPLE